MFRRGSARRKSAAPSAQELSAQAFSPLSTRIYVIYGDSDEFEMERQMLWMDMLPELQSYAFHSGFDIEWIDPLSERGSLTETMVDRIMAGVEAEDSWLICLLGEKYGTTGPPNEMLKEEFEAIRAAVFEQSADLKLLDQHYVLDRTVKKGQYRLNTPVEDEKLRSKLAKVVQKGAKSVDLKLLDQHYVLDRTVKKGQYRLNTPVEDEKLRSKLAKVVQKGAKSAYDEGTINQINSDRQKRFFWSPIHRIAD
ncbi:unnamed protein product, partial [Strongylus vulgaris]